MIVSRPLHHLLLSLTLISSAASAVGLGEIKLHSRIGEPFRAEVPVITGGASLDSGCFSLAPLPASDIPVITNGRMRLIRVGQDYRLIISGNKVIDEPILAINLRAGCGLDLQREYVLLPGPPVLTPVSRNEVLTQGSARQSEPSPQWRENLVANNREHHFSSDDISEPPAKPKPKRRAKQKVTKPVTPLPPDTLAGLASGRDRIVLGAALDDPPPPTAGAPLSSTYDMNERILKMETTLHLLNQEVDKLSTALSLGAESRAMRDQLHELQSRQSATSTMMPSAQAAQSVAPARRGAGHDGWLELLFGLLLGGTVSAGVAHLVSRRQDSLRTFDASPRIAKPGKPPKRASV